ncbi:rCG56103, isoform CRA_d, partial [Rattus norvegicus]
MARNAEKAMTALARFRQAQLEEGKVKVQGCGCYTNMYRASSHRVFLSSSLGTETFPCFRVHRTAKSREVETADHWRDLKKSCSDSECIQGSRGRRITSLAWSAKGVLGQLGLHREKLCLKKQDKENKTKK